MLKKGFITKWNDKKGYGFITPEGEKKSIFVHINDFTDKQKRPSLNRSVSFRISSKNGKLHAIDVTLDTHNSNIRKKGILTSWNAEKGYGFITPIGETKEIFIHISEYQGQPVLNDKLTFSLSTDKNGRACATNAVKFQKDTFNLETNDTNTISLFSLFFILIFFLLISHFTKEGTLPIYIIPYYIIISTFTFFIYVKDKEYAQVDNWRVSEKTLHLLSILGGWPGALIAQNKLRHKSSKSSFKIIYFFTILINLFFLLYLYNSNIRVYQVI